MQLKVHSRHLNGVMVIEPEIVEDDRGFFVEIFRADQFEALGLPTQFVQDNHSRSAKDVIRGLHFQFDPPMSKIMRVTQGRAWLVAVDIRKGSPTLGEWFGLECSEENRLQLYAPAGFARGFCALSDYADIQYKCTGMYNHRGEGGIAWNDPQIGVQWPVATPHLSSRDQTAPTLAHWLASPEADHYRFEG